MQNMSDIKEVFRKELNQWFIKQTHNPYEDYYLYYMESNSKHDGELIICSDAPLNPEYKLAAGQKIRKDATIEQNMILFYDVLRTLPILSI